MVRSELDLVGVQLGRYRGDTGEIQGRYRGERYSGDEIQGRYLVGVQLGDALQLREPLA